MNLFDRKGDWLQTYSGIAYWPLDPRASEVAILDIAHALGMVCRYAGHCKKFYSVAEHCVHVSRIVPPQDALAGLLHDAPEAYIHDITRPLKRHLGGYHGIERLNWLAICDAFGIPEALPKSVHDADTSMLFAERHVLLREPPSPWGFADPGLARDVRIQCWSPEVAKLEFTGRFLELILERSRKCA